MVLAILFSFVFIQCLAYFFADAKKIKRGRLWVLLALFFFYIIVLPFIFLQQVDGSDNRCGLPMIGFTFGFWLVGGGLTIITHISYYCLKKVLGNG